MPPLLDQTKHLIILCKEFIVTHNIQIDLRSWNPSQHSVHESLPLDIILSQLNPFITFLLQSSKIF